MVCFKVRTEEKLWAQAVKGKELVVKREAECLVPQSQKFWELSYPLLPFRTDAKASPSAAAF